MAQDCPTLTMDDDQGRCETLVDIPSEKGRHTQFRLAATEVIERPGLCPDIALIDLRYPVKMGAVGRFAGDAVHDFSNIFTGIVSCTQLLIEASRDNPELKNHLVLIRSLSHPAAGLVG